MPDMTIRQVVAIIEQMVNGPDEKLAAHGRTLVGPRARGSTTEKGLGEVPGDRTLYETTDTLVTTVRRPGCRYFQGLCPELVGRLGAAPYYTAKTALWGFTVDHVCRRQGPHGPELYLNRSPAAVELPRTDILTVVLGPTDEYPGFPDGVVYSWHPGEVLANLREDEEPSDWTAVKLHNG